MSKWTDWRLLAHGNEWFDDDLTDDYRGAACYELGVGRSSRSLVVVYVGETGDERTRVLDYAKHGSHLKRKINTALRQGWTLFYHAQAVKNRKAAIKMQNRRLHQRYYPWNTQKPRKPR